jgi:uncharacterized membrane protein
MSMKSNEAGASTHQTSNISHELNGGAHYAPTRSHQGLPSNNSKKLANGLAWFSIGLGLSELLAPGVIAKISGVSENRKGLIRLYGLRELASGFVIFSQRDPAAGVWSRVAGDALDLASLGAAFTSPNASRGRILFATANVLAVTALDVACANQLSNGRKGIHAKGTCIVNRDPDEVYAYWRNFANLSRFMKHLESVEETEDGKSHWIARGPAGMKVEWDATIIADEPGRLITWRSLENSDVDNAGAVRFERATGDRGTIVKVNIQYDPPAGIVGSTIATLFGEEPEQQLDDDLRRFKQVIEVGEVVVSDATLLGTGYMAQRPGRPAAASELQHAEKLPSQLNDVESTERRSSYQ